MLGPHLRIRWGASRISQGGLRIRRGKIPSKRLFFKEKYHPLVFACMNMFTLSLLVEQPAAVDNLRLPTLAGSPPRERKPRTSKPNAAIYA